MNGRQSRRFSFLLALLLSACVFSDTASAQSGWIFQEVQGSGYYVLAAPGALHKNDGWWYRPYYGSYKRYYQFGNGYAVTNKAVVVDKERSTVDRLAEEIIAYSKQKQSIESLLLANQAEQERLRQLSNGVGFNGGYGQNYRPSYTQRGSTVYGYTSSFKAYKTPFDDLQIGAEMIRLGEAAREQHNAANAVTQNLLKTFNNSVDRYTQLKAADQEYRARYGKTESYYESSGGEPESQPNVQQYPGGHNQNGNRQNGNRRYSRQYEPEEPYPEEEEPEQNPKEAPPSNDVPPPKSGSKEWLNFRVQRALTTISKRCVRCHDGTASSQNQTLNLANLADLEAERMKDILESLTTGNLKKKMPLGGPYLSQELIGDIYLLSGLCEKK